MKRAVYILSLIAALAAFIASPLSAQDWQLVHSGVTDNLYDIFFIDKTTGWAVGADSTIIKTTDEGYTWFRQTGGVAAEYRCVYFRNPLLGWIGGTGGLVLHTTDGGESWVRQETEGITVVNNFDFVNDSTGWLAASDGGCGSWGCDGAVLKTTNGGETWITKIHTPILDSSGNPEGNYLGRYHSVDFIDENFGCASVEIAYDRGFQLGDISYSTNGGNTWSRLNYKQSFMAITNIVMNDTNSFIIGTHYGLEASKDRFQTPRKMYEPLLQVFDFSVPVGHHLYSLGAYTNHSLCVMRYTGDSETPEFQYLDGPPYTITKGRSDISHIFGICMLDSTTGWVCGDTGRLWRRPAVIDGITPLPSPGNLDVAIESVYPNPLALDEHGTATVRFSVHRESVLAFEVRDVLGRVVLSKNNTTPYPPGMHEETLPLHGLRAGMYFVSVRSAGGTNGNVIVFIR